MTKQIALATVQDVLARFPKSKTTNELSLPSLFGRVCWIEWKRYSQTMHDQVISKPDYCWSPRMGPSL